MPLCSWKRWIEKSFRCNIFLLSTISHYFRLSHLTWWRKLKTSKIWLHSKKQSTRPAVIIITTKDIIRSLIKIIMGLKTSRKSFITYQRIELMIAQKLVVQSCQLQVQNPKSRLWTLVGLLNQEHHKFPNSSSNSTLNKMMVSSNSSMFRNTKNHIMMPTIRPSCADTSLWRVIVIMEITVTTLMVFSTNGIQKIICSCNTSQILETQEDICKTNSICTNSPVIMTHFQANNSSIWWISNLNFHNRRNSCSSSRLNLVIQTWCTRCPSPLFYPNNQALIGSKSPPLNPLAATFSSLSSPSRS